MADINIQRKKSSPSPWLLILLVLLALAVVAYFLLRTDSGTTPPVEQAAPATSALSAAEADSLADATPSAADEAAVADMAADEVPVSPDDLATYATSQTDQPDYARRGLQLLTTTLVDLADRDDLRDPGVSEKRDQLTSATSRFDEPNTNLRPGFVAVAALMQAMQQKAYPELEGSVSALVVQANQLSGRTSTPTERTQAQTFFTRAADIVRALSAPPTV